MRIKLKSTRDEVLLQTFRESLMEFYEMKRESNVGFSMCGKHIQ